MNISLSARDESKVNGYEEGSKDESKIEGVHGVGWEMLGSGFNDMRSLFGRT